MLGISEYIENMEAEQLREQKKECNKRDGECWGCPYDEVCEEEEILNSLDEW